ncbi:hypothetical protein KCH_22720 [Kitasatospora cheerisanensis KCTC 2395]|uniref:Uncharacterized protein n=1 Tax=Kitasatospora cheerisanensis KCTC 2395 TaxID=1348663 RepID=A0A066Z8F3_9ACTN|nr:hypothetical protein KCH_22720 [Kitasatospora cheerisanensis KCTC 2395]
MPHPPPRSPAPSGPRRGVARTARRLRPDPLSVRSSSARLVPREEPCSPYAHNCPAASEPR